MAATLHTFVNSFQNRLEEPVRRHLRNVYACLSVATVAATVGACVHLFTDIARAGLLSNIGALGLLLALLTTPDNGKNQKLRIGYLLGFAFLSGLGFGPLLDAVIKIDPSIVITALFATALVFVSFSISALLAERGRWLYLGGILIGVLNAMLCLALVNFFLRSVLLHQAYVYVGLFLMSGFVIYDTQLIVEKNRAGSKDFVEHSLDLFTDLIGIFRHILVILAEKEQAERSRKRKQ